MNETPLVVASNVVLEYHDGSRDVRALDGIDLAIQRGEFVGLVGPSGSGKSSLLFVLAGLRPPTSGRVAVMGEDLPAYADASAGMRRRRIGFLFQEPFLVPYLSVRENALTHAPGDAAEGRVEALAQAIGMTSMLDERPHRLSGGERQRASLLRALANNPDLILADEPTASLDQQTGHAVMDVLRTHTKDAGLLVVTHDRGMIEDANRVLFLRDGRLKHE